MTANSTSVISSRYRGSATQRPRGKNRFRNGIAVRVASVPSWIRHTAGNRETLRGDVWLSVPPSPDVEQRGGQVLAQGGEAPALQVALNEVCRGSGVKSGGGEISQASGLLLERQSWVDFQAHVRVHVI